MSDKSAPGADTNVRRLLILDDDVMTGETIRRVGEFAGLESVHSTSPREFFRLVTEWSPDVIALDLLMPEMDGVEVMARLSELHCDADLIITSGVGDKVLNAASLSASGHGLNTIGVLSKPFSPARLRSLLVRPEGPAAKGADALRGRAVEELTVAEIRRAIDAREITVVYQPKIFCKTGTLAGFEALARWSFNGRPVPPDTFIPLAEEHGLIDDLTRLIVDQALRWTATISSSGYHDPSMGIGQTQLSLNISARTLTNDALFRWVVSLCDELGIDRGRVVFELTESSAMGDAVTALDTLTRLRMQGFKLSIDDFGTGFSSMVQLVRLPFSEIKIDKSFVMASGASAESRAIIRSIADLGRSLGLLSTAEGVEDQETLDYLQSLGCDLAQGYFIGRPLRGDAVLEWFRQREDEREAFRLDSVRESTLFGSPPERRFDRITQLARRVFNVPKALIVFIDRDQVWIKSGADAGDGELPRSETFCTYTLASDDALIVRDARTDERFRELEVVAGTEGIRFYAGYPLCLPNGAKIGTLCVLDRVSRDLAEREIELLRCLAGMAEAELADSSGSYDWQLAGVLSRNGFCHRASLTLALADSLNEQAAVMVFTLDELGEVNRKFGRVKGDKCLQAVADAINQIVDASDLVGRYRGGELVVIRMNASVADGQALFEKFQRALNQCSGRLAVPVHALLSMALLQSDEPAALELAIEEARASATGVGTSIQEQRP